MLNENNLDLETAGQILMQFKFCTTMYITWFCKLSKMGVFEL